MGVSLGSRQFSIAYFRHVIEFVRPRFARVLFLIADTPHVYTFIAIKGTTTELALGRVRTIGTQKVRSITRAIRGVSGSENFVEVKRWDELENDMAFRRVRSGIYGLYDTDEIFRRDIADTFIRRLTAYGSTELPEKRYNIGHRYILEELAAMIFLQEIGGYRTQLAPAEAPEVLVNFYAGKYRSHVMLPKYAELRPLAHIVVAPNEGRASADF